MFEDEAWWLMVIAFASIAEAAAAAFLTNWLEKKQRAHELHFTKDLADREYEREKEREHREEERDRLKDERESLREREKEEREAKRDLERELRDLEREKREEERERRDEERDREETSHIEDMEKKVLRKIARSEKALKEEINSIRELIVQIKRE